LRPLEPFAEALLSDAGLERELERVVNEEGVVRDDASPALRKVRRELRGPKGSSCGCSNGSWRGSIRITAWTTPR